MRVLACALAALVLFSDGGEAGTAGCSTFGKQHHAQLREGLAAARAAMSEAAARAAAKPFKVLKAPKTLEVVATPLLSTATHLDSLSDVLSGASDATADALAAALPEGFAVSCLTSGTGSVTLGLRLNASEPFSCPVRLDQMPDADVAAINLGFGAITHTLAGTATLSGTVAIEVRDSGAVSVDVASLRVVAGASAAVETTCALDVVGKVPISGSASLALDVPFATPDAAGASAFVAALPALRLGGVEGSLIIDVSLYHDATAASILPAPILIATDSNVFDEVEAELLFDGDITELQGSILAMLRELPHFSADLSNHGFNSFDLDMFPGSFSRGITETLQLAPIAELYFAGTRTPSFSGLGAYLKAHKPLSHSNETLDVMGLTVSGGWSPRAGEVGMRLRFDYEQKEAARIDGLSSAIAGLLPKVSESAELMQLLSATPTGLRATGLPTQGVVVAQAAVDVSLVLSNSLLNTGLSSAGMLANAFLRVNEMHVEAHVSHDSFSFTAELSDISTLEVRDGSFALSVGARTTIEASAPQQLSLLSLVTNSTEAAGFLSQVPATSHSTIDVLLPVVLPATFTGDRSMTPVLHMYDQSLTDGLTPEFRLDLDLSFAAPGLPGGKGGSADSVAKLAGSLTSLVSGLSQDALPNPASLSGAGSVGKLLKGLGGIDFAASAAEFLTLQAAFNLRSNGLPSDLRLDTSLAEQLLQSSDTQVQFLEAVQLHFPTVFAKFSDGLYDGGSQETFNVANYLEYFQVSQGLVASLEEADAAFGQDDLLWVMSLQGAGLSKHTAWGLVRYLGLTDAFPLTGANGVPNTADGKAFSPLDHLALVQEKLGVDGVVPLARLLGGSSNTHGDSDAFQNAVFAAAATASPSLSTAYTTTWGSLPFNPTTATPFDWRDHMPEVGAALGLGADATAQRMPGLLGKRPTMNGMLRFLGLRLLATQSPLQAAQTRAVLDGLRLQTSITLSLASHSTSADVTSTAENLLSSALSIAGVDGYLPTSGNGIATPLTDLEAQLACSATMDLSVSAVLDFTSGTPLVYLSVEKLQVAADVAAVSAPAKLDYTTTVFDAVVNASISVAAVSSATPASPVVCIDEAVSLPFTLQGAVGSLTTSGSLSGDFAFSGGSLPAPLVLYKPRGGLFSADRPVFLSDFVPPTAASKSVYSGMAVMSDVATHLGSHSALNTNLPLVNRTLNGLLGTGSWGDALDMSVSYSQVLAEYPMCFSGGACPPVSAVVATMREKLQKLADGRCSVARVEGGERKGSFVLSTELVCEYDVLLTPALNELYGDDTIDFSSVQPVTTHVTASIKAHVYAATPNGFDAVTEDDVTLLLEAFSVAATTDAGMTSAASFGLLPTTLTGSGSVTASVDGTLGDGRVPVSISIAQESSALSTAGEVDVCTAFSPDIYQKIFATDSSLCAKSANVFQPHQVTSKSMYGLNAFSGLTAGQFASSLRGLLSAVQSTRRTPAFRYPWAFSGVTVGDVFDASSAFDNIASQFLVPQKEQDRVSHSLCVTAADLPLNWNTKGSTPHDSLEEDLRAMRFFVVLNEAWEMEIHFDTTLASEASGAALAAKVGAALNAVGLGQVSASLVDKPEGVALRLCTAESLKATDLRVRVERMQTGAAAYASSDRLAGSPSLLGFASGTFASVPRVPSFTSIMGLVDVIEAATLSTTTVTLEASSQEYVYELLFELEADIALPTVVTGVVVDNHATLHSANFTGDITLKSSATFKSTFGMRVGIEAEDMAVRGVPQGGLAFNLPTAQTFVLVLDGKEHSVTLSAGKDFVTELRAQLQLLDLNNWQAVTVATHGTQAVSLRTKGVSVFETRIPDQLASLSGLTSQKAIARRFESVFKDMSVEISCDGSAKVAVEGLYGLGGATGSGTHYGSWSLDATFGSGTLLSVNDLRHALLSSPSEVLSAKVSGGGFLTVPLLINTPSGLTSGTYRSFPNLNSDISNGEWPVLAATLTTPSMPNLGKLADLRMADLADLVSQGTDFLFGNTTRGVRGLASDHSLLDETMPFINYRLGTTVSAAQTLMTGLTDALRQAQGTAVVDSLVQAAEIFTTVLGLDDAPECATGPCSARFDYDDASHKLTLTIERRVATNTAAAFGADIRYITMLDNPDDLWNRVEEYLTTVDDVTGSLPIALQTAATVRLELILDMAASPPGRYLGLGSGVAVEYFATAKGSATLQVGPSFFDLDTLDVSMGNLEGGVGTAHFMPSQGSGTLDLGKVVDAHDDMELHYDRKARAILSLSDYPSLVLWCSDVVPYLQWRYIDSPTPVNFVPKLSGVYPVSMYGVQRKEDVLTAMFYDTHEDYDTLGALAEYGTAFGVELNSLLGELDTAIVGASGVLSGADVPVVGDLFRQQVASKFLGSFRQELAQVMAEDLSKAAKATVAAVVRMHLTNTFTAASLLKSPVTVELVDAQGNSKTGVYSSGFWDGSSISDTDAVEWTLHIGVDSSVWNGFIDFDFSKDLPLHIEGAKVNMDIAWELSLVIGYSRINGVYCRLGSAQEMAATAKISFDSLDARASLSMLEGTTKAHPIPFPSQVFGQVGVKIYDYSYESRLTLYELRRSQKNIIAARAEFRAALGIDATLGSVTEGSPSYTTSFYTYHATTSQPSVLEGAYAGKTASLPHDEVFFTDMTDQKVDLGTTLVIDLYFDVGRFVTSVALPLLRKVEDAVKPLLPVAEGLAAALPVMSDVLGVDVSLLTLPGVLLNQELGVASMGGNTQGAAVFAAALQEIASLVSLAVTVSDSLASSTDSTLVAYGNWKVTSAGFERYASHVPRLWFPPAQSSHVLDFTDDTLPLAKNAQVGSNPMRALMSSFVSADSIISAPMLSANGVLGLITGSNSDQTLVSIATPELLLDVCLSLRLADGPMTVDFAGSYAAKAVFSAGYRASGLRKVVEEGNPFLGFDGFYVGDVTNGPDVSLDGHIVVGASANAPRTRVSAFGAIALDGRIDHANPNGGDAVLLDEVKAEVAAQSFLSIYDIEFDACGKAGLTAESFNALAGWGCAGASCAAAGVWETTADVTTARCIASIDVHAAAPVGLATVTNGQLVVNVGLRGGADAVDVIELRHISGESGTEQVQVLQGAVPEASQRDDRLAQTYDGVATTLFEGGAFSDTLVLTNPASSGTFKGGDGGVDRLIVDFSTTSGALHEGFIGTTAITGFGIPSPGLQYSGFEYLTVRLNSDDSVVTINGCPVGLRLTVETTGGTNKVVTNAGPDIADLVTIIGGTGQDLVVVESATGAPGSVGSYLWGLGMGSSLLPRGIQTLQVRLTSPVADVLQVNTTSGMERLDIVASGGGADVISIGNGRLTQITSPVTVSAVAGSGAMLSLDGSSDIDAQSGEGVLTESRVSGLGMPDVNGVQYEGFSTLKITAASTPMVMQVVSTHAAETLILGSTDGDNITIDSTNGTTVIETSLGNDTLTVTGEGAIAGTLKLDGSGGFDAYAVHARGVGSAHVIVADTGNWAAGEESNTLEVYGTSGDDTFLHRSVSLSVVHPADGTSERIDVGASMNGGITVHGLEGDDMFVTDSTPTSVTQIGGAGNDSFLIGQAFATPRDANALLAAADVFPTALTSAGYLSNGNAFPMACHGGSGNDVFSVTRNLGGLALLGGAGADSFTIRAYALAEQLTDSDGGPLPDPSLGQVDVVGGDDDDTVFYLHGAKLTVDGGDGEDSLVAVGSASADVFVVTKDAAYGAGLYVPHEGVENLDVATGAGDDSVYIMSTAAHINTRVYGGLGSDSVFVTPQSVPVSVASKDWKGHSALVNHVVSSDDPQYDGLQARGVAVEVVDMDTPHLHIVVPDGRLTVTEGLPRADNVRTRAKYSVSLGNPPGSIFPVTVTVAVSQSASERAGAATVSVFPSVLTFQAHDWDMPQEVTVAAIDDNVPEGDEVVHLTHIVSQVDNTGKTGWLNGVWSSPVPVRIVDSDSPSITLLKLDDPAGTGMRMSESGKGISNKVWYEAILRPCTATVPADIQVTIAGSDQVQVSPQKFSFDPNYECTQMVTVTAVDDTVAEGTHVVSLKHTATGSGAAHPAGSLVVEDMVIEILDDDAPGVGLLETLGSTTVAEVTGEADEYSIFLTAAPAAGTHVTVDVAQLASKTTSEEARMQLIVSPTSVVFSSANYSAPVVVSVRAIGDEAMEDVGEGTQLFASQPSLAYQVQGALSVSGADVPVSATPLHTPVLLPGEANPAGLPVVLATEQVDEAQQDDRLMVQNVGAAVHALADIAEATVAGMGMRTEIRYNDLERLDVNMGPADDEVRVSGTHRGAVYVDAGAGSDVFNVLSASGPTVLIGAEGNDAYVLGNAGVLEKIADMVATVGGAGDDAVSVVNTAGNALGLSGTLTRTHLTGLAMSPLRGSTSVSVQTVAVRSSTMSGTFALTLTVDGTPHTATFNYGVSASDMEATLQATVFTCSPESTPPCAKSFAVDKLDGTLYLVRYTGLLAAGHTASALTLDTTQIGGASEEVLAGTRMDARAVPSGLVYADVEALNIDLGLAADVLNVQGTSVPTTVRTNTGNDVVAIGSDAALADVVAAEQAQFFGGRVDYVEAPVTVDVGTGGSSRLLVSDADGTTNRNIAMAAGSITGLSKGSITYAGSDYTRGVSVWLGHGSDVVSVTSTVGAEVEKRTVTSLFTGPGADTVDVTLKKGENGFFVVNAEGGSDMVSAKNSDMPLLLLGGEGDDVIEGGAGADIIFGDTGFAVYGTDTLGLPRATTAPLSATMSPLQQATTDGCEGTGADKINDATGSSLVFGGGGNDDITGSPGDTNVIFGDFGFATYDEHGLKTMESTCDAGGNDVVGTGSATDIVFGGYGSDMLFTGDGNDVVFGDHGSAQVQHVLGSIVLEEAKSILPESGGDDIIEVASGMNTLVGGAGADSLKAFGGTNIMFGDFGSVHTIDSEADSLAFESISTDLGGSDKLQGGVGFDTLIGGQGDDKLTGYYGNDILVGDHAQGKLLKVLAPSAERAVYVATTSPLLGGQDTLNGDFGDDILMGGHGADSVWGEPGADVVFGDYGQYNATNGLVSMMSLEQQVTGGSNTRVNGGSENDFIFCGGGDDSCAGDSGSDIIFGDHGMVVITTEGEPAEGRALHAATAKKVEASSHTAEGGDDIVDSGEGDDVIFGGAGIDTIQCGGGLDTVFGDHGSATVDAVQSAFVSVLADDDAHGAGDSITCEGLAEHVILGGQGADQITSRADRSTVFGDHGSFTRGADNMLSMSSAFYSNGASDTITINDGDAYIFGGAGDDHITTHANDVVFGDHGAATVQGVIRNLQSVSPDAQFGGADIIELGNGSDIAFGGQGGDAITTGAGNKWLFGDHGSVDTDGSTSNLASTSPDQGGVDAIITSTGNNYVFGGADADTITTGSGDDVVFGDHGAATVQGAIRNLRSVSPDAQFGGADIIELGSGSDIAFGGQGGDAITTGAGNKWLFGDHGSVDTDGSTSNLASTSPDQGGVDAIITSTGNNYVFGGADADTITTGSGDDVVFGDHGAIVTASGALVSATSTDTQSEHGGPDVIAAGEGNNVVLGGQGNDIVEGGSQKDWVVGDFGELQLTGDQTTLLAREDEGGDDVIRTFAGDDYVLGGAGNDNIDTAEGADVVFGDNGQITTAATTVRYESLNSKPSGDSDVVSAGLDDDIVFGGNGNDVLKGGEGNNWMFGDMGLVVKTDETTLSTLASEHGGADVIQTLSGRDVVFGGESDDLLQVGLGDDIGFGDFATVKIGSIETSLESVPHEGSGKDVIELDEGFDIAFGGNDDDNITSTAGITWAFGDHGKITRTDGRDELIATVTTGGDDSIITADDADYLFGGAGHDDIAAGSGVNVVFGDHGHITRDAASITLVATVDLLGYDDADTIHTGEHADFVFGGQGGDTIDAGNGDNTVFGDVGRVSGGADMYIRVRETVTSAGGPDTVTTGSGSDFIAGGAASDAIFSGAGDDVVFGDDGKWEVLEGNNGTLLHLSVVSSTPSSFEGAGDVVDASAGHDLVFGGSGDDIITSGAGNDWVFGDDGNVELRSTDMTLITTFGLAGNDRINSAEGDDVVFGGPGDDTIDAGADRDVVFGDSGRMQGPEEGTSNMLFAPVSPHSSQYGGDDEILGGDGDDILMGQQGADTVQAGAGQDVVFGDQAVWALAGPWAHGATPSWQVLYAKTVNPVDGLGGNDTLYGNEGDDYLFGGASNDVVYGDEGADVILGDHGMFNGSLPVEQQFVSLYTTAADAGGDDTLHGGAGDDRILGQQGDDTIYGDEGEDDITGGHNVLGGADGDDTIMGGDAADVVLGDNGHILRKLYVSRHVPAPPAGTPTPISRPSFCDNYTMLTASSGKVQHSGADGWYGPNERLCWQTTCASGSVKVSWQQFATEARYDLVQLYSVARDGTSAQQWEHSGWRLPEAGVYSEDVLVHFVSDGYTFDKGFTFEYTCTSATSTPETAAPATPAPEAVFVSGPAFAHSFVWERYPDVPGSNRTYADVQRVVQRFDDVDHIGGHDHIEGGAGDDVLRGQRGSDYVDGGDGDDEVHGDMDSDVLQGGAGADILVGDVGNVVRAFDANGNPRVNPQTQAWHRNVVLEEQAVFAPTRWAESWRTVDMRPEEGHSLLQADVLLSMGGYQMDGEKLLVRNTLRPWRTGLAGLTVDPRGAGHDTMHGGSGDDVLLGMRGNDTLHGDDGNDLLYGDSLSSVYHYDSCAPLVTTVMRVMPTESIAVPHSRYGLHETPLTVSDFGDVVHVPMWMMPEQVSRAGAMRPVDDAAIATVVPEDVALMLDAVGAGDLRLASGEGVMRAFVATVPDVLRHSAMMPGNDVIYGGAGNDVLVGDNAFHHSMMNVNITSLDTLRERAAARWGEVQTRLLRFSADATTYEAQEGVASPARTVTAGDDTLHGGDGADTLVGDRLEAFTDVMFHEPFDSFTKLEASVSGLMRTYNDFEVLAVDAAFVLFEAHHQIVRSLLSARWEGVAANTTDLRLSNDVISGGNGDDMIVGDSLLMMMKGLFMNDTFHSNYVTSISAASFGDSNPFEALLDSLTKCLDEHITRSFLASDDISAQNLRRRWEWNTLPNTTWGSDVLDGDAGNDAVTGDYGLVVVATFEGDPFHPSTRYGLRSMHTALDAHLHYIEAVLCTRMTAPQLKWRMQALQDQSFDASMAHLSLYHDKGWGVRGHDEAASRSQSDLVNGGDGEDVLSGGNYVAVLPKWRPTNSLVPESRAFSPSPEFFRVLDGEHWARLREYTTRNRGYDRDVLTGGGARDVFLLDNDDKDAVRDKEHWVDSIYVRPAYAYLAPQVRDIAAGALQGTCLNELAQDGVIAARAVHQYIAFPAYGWHGLFGVVWGRSGVVTPTYYLDHHRHHVGLKNATAPPTCTDCWDAFKTTP